MPFTHTLRSCKRLAILRTTIWRAWIESALAAGKRGNLVHVGREPVEAYQCGVIPRATDARKEGRQVTTDSHSKKMHANPNAMIRKLAAHNGDAQRRRSARVHCGDR
jgi:hypothetical protein